MVFCTVCLVSVCCMMLHHIPLYGITLYCIIMYRTHIYNFITNNIPSSFEDFFCAGMQTLLVLSGVTTRAEVQNAHGKFVPDFVAPSVASLKFPS